MDEFCTNSTKESSAYETTIRTDKNGIHIESDLKEMKDTMK